MQFDADLQSIQEVRDFLREAKQAQHILERMTQAQIDEIVRSMAEAAEKEAEQLAAAAVEETGFGRIADKKIKNLFVAQNVYNAIKDMKTVGIIHRDEMQKVWEIAQPVGIIAGITPSTNPTSTVIFKAMIAVKARNAIVFSPHPSALRCSMAAAEAMQAAAERAGAPQGLIHCLTKPTMAATEELMKHKLTDIILATGGTAMVKAAYSSGKPALGVGPGNVPVYIHASARIRDTVRRIIESKTFDYGTICASEQAIIVDDTVKNEIMAEFKRQGCYFLNEQEKTKVAAVILLGPGKLNPGIVGKSPQVIADMAGIQIPAGTTLLAAEETKIGKEHAFSIEKLTTILAFYTVHDWQEGCKVCIELMELGGLGHTLGIHCEDANIIETFGLEKPASRIIVNAGTTFGGIGATTGIFPSMTLGCGSFGNNITSDNVGPQHLLNIKRVAFGLRDMELPRPAADHLPAGSAASSNNQLAITREEVKSIIRGVLSEAKLLQKID